MTARTSTGTATRSAHAPLSTTPTTVEPTGGPPPRSAPRSTTPTTSHPGSQPAGLLAQRTISPRLRLVVDIRTIASVAAVSGSGTSLRASRSAFPVVVRASI